MFNWVSKNSAEDLKLCLILVMQAFYILQEALNWSYLAIFLESNFYNVKANDTLLRDALYFVYLTYRLLFKFYKKKFDRRM